MDIKRVVIFASLILLLGFISAESCSIVLQSSCSDTIVMGLSDSTNAHGEIASQPGNYPYVLCCDFAGPDYTCTGSNKILGLSATTNAHAEIPENDVYATDVCFADLDYHSGTTCPEGKNIILIRKTC